MQMVQIELEQSEAYIKQLQDQSGQEQLRNDNKVPIHSRIISLHTDPKGQVCTVLSASLSDSLFWQQAHQQQRKVPINMPSPTPECMLLFIAVSWFSPIHLQVCIHQHYCAECFLPSLLVVMVVVVVFLGVKVHADSSSQLCSLCRK